MRIFLTFLIDFAAAYLDVEYNHGKLSDDLICMERSKFHRALATGWKATGK